MTGETRAAFSYKTHGTFYLIDFLFIVIGLSGLFVINKKGGFLFFAIFALCAVTSGLNIVENSYSQRVGLIYPFLVIVSGVGIATTIFISNSKVIMRLLSIVIALLYFVSLVNLMHIYFFRFPVYASDGWFFQDRVLSKYISYTQERYSDAKILVYTPEPKIVFEEYLFYTNSYNKNNVASINIKLNQKVYSFKNLLFSDKCPDNNPERDTVVIIDGSFECKKLSDLTTSVRITRLKDVYENYRIYNDKLCSNLNLARFVSRSAYQDFVIEKQPPNEFCMNWITEIKQ